ncbi:hypothetical protein CDIK_0831 [Cucumispora dikerogammari]|nr:hypothetical protein CDIK_0831 [Cucumispora dikerogammari]
MQVKRASVDKETILANIDFNTEIIFGINVPGGYYKTNIEKFASFVERSKGILKIYEFYYHLNKYNAFYLDIDSTSILANEKLQLIYEIFKANKTKGEARFAVMTSHGKKTDTFGSP